MKWLQGTQGGAPKRITEQSLEQSLEKLGNGHTEPVRRTSRGLDPVPQVPKEPRFIHGGLT